MTPRLAVASVLVPVLLVWGCGGDDGGNGNGTGPPPTATTITQVSGDGQTGVAGTALAAPFVVRVTDAQGDVVSGLSVSWSVTAGGGSLSAASTLTNSQGQASVTLTLGPAAGANAVTASSAGLTGSPVTFSSTGTAPPTPTTITRVSGDGQTGVAGTELAATFVVRVTDDQGSGVSGIGVAWDVTAGGGSLSAAATQTNSQGQASVSLTLGPAAGANTVTASVSGLTGSPVTFNATATDPPTPTTIVLVSGDSQNGKTLESLSSPFVVRITDDQGAGTQGVTVSWAIMAGDGSLSSSSSDTNSQGQASVTFTPGASLGESMVTASVSGLSGSPITFTARTTVLVIEMRNTLFVYPDGGINSGVTVAVGDTIEWVNRDGVQHTATSNIEPAGGTAFASGLMGTNARFRFVPNVVGTWEYFCEVHPSDMLGATITAQ